jgi:hypothetical protein
MNTGAPIAAPSGAVPQEKPVGTMKKLVSLVDRGEFDMIAYPQDANSTLFQPTFKPYHNFTPEVRVWPFAGAAEWGKRITFTIPMPWETDLVSWIALRIKPQHWLPADIYNHLYSTKDWAYVNSNTEWLWAKSLGSVAIAKAELEIDGITVEQWSGDWIQVWGRITQDLNHGIGWDTDMLGPTGGTDDGSFYCYLPFWFSRHRNTAFPLISTTRPVRVHITFRPFKDVVRMRSANKVCDQTPLQSSFEIQDLSLPFLKKQVIQINQPQPTMEVAEMVCGTVLIDGELRKAYRDYYHEILMNPVVEMQFGEPLKYTVGAPNGSRILIGLPLTAFNGPLKQLIWVLRRKGVAARADWTNFSATLEDAADPVWNPTQPLLCKATLLVGTATWFDEEESVLRASGSLPLAGGIRVFGNYIYVYNFTEEPTRFDPCGSVNASRTDLRLNLEVEQPLGDDKEWEVLVWAVETNWMRFQNGLANQVFMD